MVETVVFVPGPFQGRGVAGRASHRGVPAGLEGWGESAR